MADAAPVQEVADLLARAKNHLATCAACDDRQPVRCTCPDGPPRAVLQGLIAEVERLTKRPDLPGYLTRDRMIAQLRPLVRSDPAGASDYALGLFTHISKDPDLTDAQGMAAVRAALAAFHAVNDELEREGADA